MNYLSSIISFIALIQLLPLALPASASFFNGVWDSSLYVYTEFPHTVALRIEIIDADTHMPIPGAVVELVARYPDYPEDSIMSAQSEADGVVVFGLSWDTTTEGRRDIDIIRELRIRHPDRQYLQLPFSLAELGSYEGSWIDYLINNRDSTRYVTISPPQSFTDYDNVMCRHVAFFDSVRHQSYKTIYRAMSNSEYDIPRHFVMNNPRDECGPYIVINKAISLNQLGDKIDIINLPVNPRDVQSRSAFGGTPQSSSPIQEESVPMGDVWSVQGLGGLSWGMTPREVADALDASVNTFDSGSGNYSAEVTKQIVWADRRLEFKYGHGLEFQDGKLVSIHLECVNGSDSQLVPAVSELIGPPTLADGDYPGIKNLVWRTGSSVIVIYPFPLERGNGGARKGDVSGVTLYAKRYYSEQFE